MDNLIAEGKTIIFITHKLQEVLDIGDNITVIRRGKDVGNISTKDATKEIIANMMVGRAVLFNVQRPDVTLGKELVVVDNLLVKNDKGLPAVDEISFEIREGEVFGIAGVEGNGQTELIEAITGLRKVESGTIVVDGKACANQRPKDITLGGVAHIPEDRHKRAAVSQFDLENNLALFKKLDIKDEKVFPIINNFTKKEQVTAALETKKYFFFSVNDKSIKMYDKNNLSYIKEFRPWISSGLEGSPLQMAFDENKNILYFSAFNSINDMSKNDLIHGIDIQSGKIIKTLKNIKALNNTYLDISNDGKFIVAINNNNLITQLSHIKPNCFLV